jgi:hypothetical protein
MALVSVVDAELTTQEAARLEALKAVVSAGIESYYKMGEALREIRDSRLYRATHSNFEDFCRETWGLSRVHAHRLIDASDVAENLLPIGNAPATESQARELTPLKREPEAQRAAWSVAVETAPESGVTAAHVKQVVDATREVVAERPDITPAELPEAVKAKVAHVAHNSGNNEWYTPAPFIAAAREVMGRIDCDPASSPIANATVQAERFFTAEDDGLQQDTWGECVWMNPPYAQPLIGQFADALAERVRHGEVQQACVLVNNATETAWFQTMLGVASAVCLLRGRVKFLDPEGNPSGAPLQGQAVLYIGPNVGEFAEAFSGYGVTLRHV